MAPKFLAPRGLNFNLSLSISSLLNQLLKHINISTLAFFHLFTSLLSQHFLKSNRPPPNLLPYSQLTPHLLQHGFCLHHSTEMSLAQVTNNLQIYKFSADFSGSILLNLSGTIKYSLHLDFLQ